MSWTKEKPTEPGWYWVKYGKREEIVHLSFGDLYPEWLYMKLLPWLIDAEFQGPLRPEE